MCGPDARYGGVTLLTSPQGGRHPSGNSLLISGTEGTVLVDPSIEVDRRGGVGADIELIAVTHAHEDHVAGLHLFPAVRVVVHPAEAAAVRDPDRLLSGFGRADAEADVFGPQPRERFHLSGHGRVDTVDDGAVFDLGRRSVTVVHLPGHTAGHCGLLVEPDGFLFLGGHDPTSFGPYYGDLSSSLDDFVTSIERLRDMDACWYGTFHHVGVLDDRKALLCPEPLRLGDRPQGRDGAAGAATATNAGGGRRRPTLYRPHVQLPFVEAVERRTAVLHLERLERGGLVVSDDGGFVAV